MTRDLLELSFFPSAPIIQKNPSANPDKTGVYLSKVEVRWGPPSRSGWCQSSQLNRILESFRGVLLTICHGDPVTPDPVSCRFTNRHFPLRLPAVLLWGKLNFCFGVFLLLQKTRFLMSNENRRSEFCFSYFNDGCSLTPFRSPEPTVKLPTWLALSSHQVSLR